MRNCSSVLTARGEVGRVPVMETTTTTPNRRRHTLVGITALLLVLSFFTMACSTDADVASDNLSKAADQFELQRRIVFINGITDEYLLTIEGRCSIESDNVDRQLEVTCQTGVDEYKKHYLGLSDNVTYLVEQLDGVNVSTDQYRVVFKPSVIIPDVEN